MLRIFYVLPLVVSMLFVSCFAGAKKQEQDSVEKKEVQAKKVEKETTKPKSKYQTVKALEDQFKAFDRGNVKQVLPNHINKDGEGIYCYFLQKGNRTVSLSLHIQYSQYNADLFELSVGEETMSYEANKSHTTGKSIEIVDNNTFKWYAKAINQEDEAFIRKIGKVGSATLQMKNKETGAVLGTVNLTKAECDALVNAIDYYIALDGAKIPKKGMVNIRSF